MIKTLSPLVLTLLLGWTSPAVGLELPLDAKASSLAFTGHATLHDFKGEARSFSGFAHVDTGTPPIVTGATLKISAVDLTTFLDTRDTNMKKWLKVEANPTIIFELRTLKSTQGSPATATSTMPAHFSVKGDLLLNHAHHAVEAEALGWREGSLLVVAGTTQIDTSDYGLPQIQQFFLTVDKKVDIAFHLAFDLPPELRPAPSPPPGSN